VESQSIGEPVTQLALSYFHKLSNDAITFNGLKDLHDIIHNRMELDTVSLYIKPENYDIKDYAKMVNSFFYTRLVLGIISIKRAADLTKNGVFE